MPYLIDATTRTYVLKSMIDCLKLKKDDDVIIETHHDIYAFWGELLAEKIGAKHFVFCVNEEYRGRNFLYEYNLDFFKFKFDRNELIALDKIVGLLFNGYKGIMHANIDYPLLVMEADPIQDVENDKVEDIERTDFNICSIGRTDKYYIEHAIHGIIDFAKAHRKKRSILLLSEMKKIYPLIYSRMLIM